MPIAGKRSASGRLHDEARYVKHAIADEDDAHHGEGCIQPSAPRRLYQPHGDADHEGEHKGRDAQPQRDRQRVRDDVSHGALRREARPHVAAERLAEPMRILHGHWPVESELRPKPRYVGGARTRWNQQRRGVARCQSQQSEREREHAPVQQDGAHDCAKQSGGGHAVISHRAGSPSTSRTSVRFALEAMALAACACIAPQRTPDVLVMASGADLESANPLVTVHPLSRQVQRYALSFSHSRTLRAVGVGATADAS